MRMLRWMSEVTKLGRIINERNRGTTKVGEISKKVQRKEREEDRSGEKNERKTEAEMVG